jgi:hypothetical protein
MGMSSSLEEKELIYIEGTHTTEEFDALVSQIPGVDEARVKEICGQIYRMGHDDGQQYIWWVRAGMPDNEEQKRRRESDLADVEMQVTPGDLMTVTVNTGGAQNR